MPTIEQHLALGKVIAELYISAQEVSLDISNTACDLITTTKDPIIIFGFNQTISKSHYNVRA